MLTRFAAAAQATLSRLSRVSVAPSLNAAITAAGLSVSASRTSLEAVALSNLAAFCCSGDVIAYFPDLGCAEFERRNNRGQIVGLGFEHFARGGCFFEHGGILLR